MQIARRRSLSKAADPVNGRATLEWIADLLLPGCTELMRGNAGQKPTAAGSDGYLAGRVRRFSAPFLVVDTASGSKRIRIVEDTRWEGSPSDSSRLVRGDQIEVIGTWRDELLVASMVLVNVVRIDGEVAAVEGERFHLNPASGRDVWIRLRGRRPALARLPARDDPALGEGDYVRVLAATDGRDLVALEIWS